MKIHSLACLLSTLVVALAVESSVRTKTLRGSGAGEESASIQLHRDGLASDIRDRELSAMDSSDVERVVKASSSNSPKFMKGSQFSNSEKVGDVSKKGTGDVYPADFYEAENSRSKSTKLDSLSIKNGKSFKYGKEMKSKKIHKEEKRSKFKLVKK